MPLSYCCRQQKEKLDIETIMDISFSDTNKSKELLKCLDFFKENKTIILSDGRQMFRVTDRIVITLSQMTVIIKQTAVSLCYGFALCGKMEQFSVVDSDRFEHLSDYFSSITGKFSISEFKLDRIIVIRHLITSDRIAVTCDLVIDILELIHRSAFIILFN